ncbi:hypothetical protein BABINDRAFT_171715 [Babjeviella inositovora NRRL Y-12698]|uniref:MATE efflux family protein n=1 Tax=Babjeviella inositovora NRRL Y-12698 TaxID=984486 RepID=A0A1E3QP96_9ASCO|nr:uncharacterized protein BABINDRAFT_171715 [Babjeviella inositovora NRRL Y-12698]ODQ79529.1 hypothetical protein BABINDRAFT_171715 [Babjeviella inositovora NRRL Y-12698]
MGLNSVDPWEEQNHEYDQLIRREVKLLSRSCFPLVISFLLQNSLSMASIFFVGRLGSAELSAVTLGSMAAIITGFSAVQGLATCLDTLCAQSFGAGRYALVGLYFQRCTALILTCFIPVALFWFYGAEYVLQFLVPEPHLVVLSSLYLRWIILGVPGFVVFETGKRYLQAQGIFNASTYILCCVAPINVVLNYLLILSPTYGLGFIGAPIAVSITYYLMALGLLLFVFLNRNNAELQPLKCWGGLDLRNAFRNWLALFALGLPGVIMVVSEFLAFEALTFMAAYLGPTHLAAQSIMASLCLISFQVPFAVGIATSTRVANLVGAGLPNSAKHTTKVSVVFGACLAVFNFSVLYFARFQIPKAFTTEQDVVDMVAATIPYIAYMTFFDQITAVTSGILRGQGRQAFGSKLNLFCYYVIGVPVAYYLAFHVGLEIRGLWVGVGGSLAFIGLVQWWYVTHVLWDDIIAQAERNE